MSKQYTCIKDGQIHLDKKSNIVIKDWSFDTIDCPDLGRPELTPYIYVGDEDNKSIVCVKYKGTMEDLDPEIAKIINDKFGELI